MSEVVTRWGDLVVVPQESAKGTRVVDPGPEPDDRDSDDWRRWRRREAADRLFRGQGAVAVRIICERHKAHPVGKVMILPREFGAAALGFMDNSSPSEIVSGPRDAADWFCYLFDHDELTDVVFACQAHHDVFTPAATIIRLVGVYRRSGKIQRLSA